MAVTTFAAIDIGSYNVSMEIFEITKKGGLKSLNSLRRSLELGRDAYSKKRITMDSLNALTEILQDYARIMQEFGVSGYRACAKSAFREARNSQLVREHIRKKTDISVDVLSNSEQRFLGYKSIASRGEEFQKTIEKGTAIVDVGGGSIQISLFDKDVLLTTQNIPIGSLRVSERLSSFENETTRLDELMDQFIRKDVLSFKRMYLKDRNIDTIILVGDYFTNLVFQNRLDISKSETREEFLRWYEHIIALPARQAAEELGVSMEVARAILPTAVTYRRLIEVLGASNIWLPGIQLTDGIAYDYAERNKLIKSTHDFDRDILNAARNIAKRYAGNKPHTDKLIQVAGTIFDAMKKGNSLNARDKLLLTVACQLHDCGKYISLVNISDCSYSIIKTTEIIGLSDAEREIIASAVRYLASPMPFYSEISKFTAMTESEFIRMSQLVAIMRLSNCMDQSYLQKIADVKAVRKEEKLVITVETGMDFTLEKGIFRENVEFFEETFDVKPVLKIRKKLN